MTKSLLSVSISGSLPTACRRFVSIILQADDARDQLIIGKMIL